MHVHNIPVLEGDMLILVVVTSSLIFLFSSYVHMCRQNYTLILQHICTYVRTLNTDMNT